MRLTLLLQTRLLQDTVERAGCQIVARLAGHRHPTWLRRMLELSVGSTSGMQIPAIIMQHSWDIGHLHRISLALDEDHRIAALMTPIQGRKWEGFWAPMCPDVLPHCMVRRASTALRLRGFSHSYFEAQARRCRHVNESIQTKQIDLPTHEVGDARLRDAEQLSDLGLAKVGAGQMRFQSHHQGRAQFHIFSFLRRTLDGIPYASKSLFAHGPSSFVKSR